MTFPDNSLQCKVCKPHKLLISFSTSGRTLRTWFVLLSIISQITVLLTPIPLKAQNEISKEPRLKAIIASEIDYPPFSYIDDNNDVVGFNIELTRAICELSQIDAKIIVEPWANIRNNLDNGQIDAIFGMYYSRERDKTFDFSQPIIKVHHVVFGRTTDPMIKNENDLKDKSLIVMRGDIMHDYILGKKLTSSPVLVDTHSEALRLLSSGNFDYALLASIPAHYWINKLELNNIRAASPYLLDTDYCFAVKEGNSELLERFDEGLAILKESGRYRDIYARWLGSEEPSRFSFKEFLKYIALILIPLIIFVAIGYAWIRTLRFQVNQRTELLKKEIDNRQQAEKRLEHVNRILLAIRNVNQLITQINDRDILLGRICESLTDTRGYNHSWIILFRKNGKPLKAFDSGIGQPMDGLFEQLKSGAFPHHLQRALESNDVIYIESPSEQCQDCPLSGRYDNRSVMTVALVNSGIKYGLLSVSVPKSFSVDQEELNYVLELANDIAYALHDLELVSHQTKLQESLQKANLIVESSPCFLFRWKAEPGWPVEYVSNNITRFGYNPKEMTTDGFRYDSLIYPEDLKEIEEMVDHHIAENQKDFLLVYRIYDSQKNIHWVEESTSIERDENGEVSAYQGILFDITDRKKAEEELRFQALLLNQIQDFVTATDLDGRITYVNESVCKALGKGREQLIGNHVDVFGENPVRGSTQNEIINETLNNETWRGEVVNIDDDKNEIILDCRSHLVRDEKNKPIAMVGISTDITEKKKKEEEFIRLLSAVEQTSEIIIITDCKGNISYVNPAFENTTGYSRDEVAGKNPRILKSGFHPAEFYESLWNTINEGKTWRGKFTNKRKNGSIYYEEASISPIFSENGNIINFVSAKRDITENVLLEEQMRQAQKMEAVGQLAGGVAHDFNNLLQVITGNIELAMMNVDSDPELKSELEEVSKAGEKARMLIAQLLAFSRRQIMKLEDIDLNSVIAGLINMLSRLIGENIQLDFVAGHQLGTVFADQGMVEQMIVNLCVNARDAMPGGGQLTIETENVLINGEYCKTHLWAHPGRYVLMNVTDTGHGMDSEILSKIFEPFFTTKPKDKGTGLGLSTVYGIVKQHDGMINAYSEPDKGTIFKVYLPTSERKASSVGSAVKGPVVGGKETVLLAEDDRMVRDLGRRILEHAGYTVVTAEDGWSAVDEFNNNPDKYDLLFIDVVMPNLGGHEAYEKMLAIRPNLPVLFASGYSENAVHTNFVLHKGLKLIQKPFTRESLLRAIRSVLDNDNGEI